MPSRAARGSIIMKRLLAKMTSRYHQMHTQHKTTPQRAVRITIIKLDSENTFNLK